MARPWVFGVFLCLPCCLFFQAGSAKSNYFGQVQSFIGTWQGQPVVSANWKGRFRPYQWSGSKFEPFLSKSDDKALQGIDLYSPLAVGNHGLIFSSQDRGSRFFDLYFWSAKTKSILPLAPDASDDKGGVCTSDQGLIAFHTLKEEKVGQIENGTLKLFQTDQKIPAFIQCVWVSNSHFFGYANHASANGETGVKGFICQAKDNAVRCRNLPSVEQLEVIGSLGVENNDSEKTVWVSGRKRGDLFRRIFRLEANGQLSNWAEVDNEEQNADHLFFSRGKTIVGEKARYFVPGLGNKKTQIFRISHLKERLFAVAADATHPRSLATWTGKKWKFLACASEAAAYKPLETLVVDELGDSHQFFYFGPSKPKKIVAWLHGGPHENVSPRFSPYFSALNALGFGVLAVNYPGSTGHGAEYERLMDHASRIRALSAVRQHISSLGAKTTIVWSVSSGFDVALDWLRAEWKPAAWIDQVGVTQMHVDEAPRALAQRHQVSYFSIRGLNDAIALSDSQANFTYQGGHDITLEADFNALFEKAKPFLAKL
jgi:hypothetical protein